MTPQSRGRDGAPLPAAVWLATLHQDVLPFGVTVVGIWPDSPQGLRAAKRACDARLGPWERKRSVWSWFTPDDWTRDVFAHRWAAVRRYLIGTAAA